MNREGDPSTAGDNELWLLQNARLSGGKILSRGGQTAVNTVEEDDCIRGIFDAGDGAPTAYGFARASYQSDDGVTWPSRTTLTVITERVWSEQNLDLDADGDTGFTRVSPDRFHDRVYVDDDATATTGLYQFKGFLAEVSNSGLTKETDETVIYGSCVLSNVMYFLAKRTNGTSTRVYSWDGTTKTEDEEIIDPNLGPLYTVGAELYCYGTTGFMRRNSSGTWSAVAYPTDTLYYSIPLTYGGLVYFAGICTTTNPDLGVVDSFDGATVSRANTLPELEAGMGSSARAACVFNSNLYVAWGPAVAGGSMSAERGGVLAKFDGTTWTDEYAGLTTGEGKTGYTLILYTDGADLYAVTTWEDDDNVSHLHYFFHSAGSDTTTWTNFKTQDENPGELSFVPGAFTHQVPVVLLSEAAT